MPPQQTVIIGGGVIGSFFIFFSLSLSEDTLRIRRAKAEADASAYTAVATYSASNAFIGNLAQVVLGQITQYYQFVLTNVQRSSSLTTSLMLIGFALIAFGCYVGIKLENKATIVYASSISGIILEFLTSGIVVFNKENIKLMDAYMQKLESFSQTLLALALLDTSADPKDKEAMRSMWLKELIQRVSSRPTTSSTTKPA